MPRQGGRKEQPGIDHQAAVAEGDLNPVGVVAWQHLLDAPFLGPVFATKPLSQKHRSTFLPPQDANPTPSFGGFGFSEEFPISYRTLQDDAFTVTDGTVNKAERLEKGSNIGWRVTVQPDGNGDVSIVLPVTTDCDARSAICAEDGRMLSHRLELTVGGP